MVWGILGILPKRINNCGKTCLTYVLCTDLKLVPTLTPEEYSSLMHQGRVVEPLASLLALNIWGPLSVLLLSMTSKFLVNNSHVSL